MFVRDRYGCRYCGTRVIDLRVLEALAIATQAYGPMFQRGSAWRIAETHPAFWWQSGSNDHVVPRARGGEVNDFENLVTACWPCQHRKSNFTLGELGWKVRPIGPGAPAKGSNLAEWDGLVELLQPLKTLAAATTPSPKKILELRSGTQRPRCLRCPSCRKNPWVYEARNGLWRVKEWPKAPRDRKWELLRRIGEEWKSLSFWPSSDLALKVAADTDEGDGIGPPGDGIR